MVANNYLSPEQVCELLPGVTIDILTNLRKRRTGPRYFKPTGERGKVVLYLESDVRAWVERSAVETRQM